MRGNLESKFAAHGTKPLELRQGQVRLEKHKKRRKFHQNEYKKAVM